jgi:hypothetical protein
MNEKRMLLNCESVINKSLLCVVNASGDFSLCATFYCLFIFMYLFFIFVCLLFLQVKNVTPNNQDFRSTAVPYVPPRTEPNMVCALLDLLYVIAGMTNEKRECRVIVLKQTMIASFHILYASSAISLDAK